jgi:hypothetical protein
MGALAGNEPFWEHSTLLDIAARSSLKTTSADLAAQGALFRISRSIVALPTYAFIPMMPSRVSRNIDKPSAGII